MAQNVIASYIGINEKAYKFTRGSAIPEVGFADGTDDDISAMIEGHYEGKIDIADYWSVGDVRRASDSEPLFQVAAHTSLRTYVSTNPSSTGRSWQTTYSMPKQSTIKWQIIGIKHDTLTTNINGYNKAAITMQTVGMLGNTANDTGTYKMFMSMNDSNTNAGGWGSCVLKTYLQGNFYNACGFKSLIKPVQKQYCATYNSATLSTSNDYVFLLSIYEVWGTNSPPSSSGGSAISWGPKGAEGTHYSNYFTSSTGTTEKIKKTGWEGASGDASGWWLRSPYSSTSGIFCFVGNSGSPYYNNASKESGVAPAACL